jgi:hypothetical protein
VMTAGIIGWITLGFWLFLNCEFTKYGNNCEDFVSGIVAILLY